MEKTIEFGNFYQTSFSCFLMCVRSLCTRCLFVNIIALMLSDLNAK